MSKCFLASSLVSLEMAACAQSPKSTPAVSKSGILLMSKEQLARYALALILLLRSHKRSKMIATAGLAPSA